MPKTVEIEGEIVEIDENYYVLYKILEEILIHLRRIGGR